MDYNAEDPDDLGRDFIVDRTWALITPVLVGAIFYIPVFYYAAIFMADMLNFYVQSIIFLVYSIYCIKSIYKNFREIIIGDKIAIVSYVNLLTDKIKNIALKLLSIPLLLYIIVSVNQTAF